MQYVMFILSKELLACGGGVMIRTEKQKSICRKYSARDKDGYVHCNDCPLVIDRRYHMCRSNSHYDRKLKEWVPDESDEWNG